MTSRNVEFLDTLAHLRRDPCEPSRRLVQAGARAVGYVGDDIPVALILAAGAVPARLRCAPAEDGARADDFVEPSFSAEARAIANHWLQGSLDHLDAVIFPRSDDSGQRLYYYLCELQRRGLCGGPRPLIFDVANLPRAASFEHTLESTRRLAAELGTATDALEPALQRVARREALLAAVQARRLLASPLPGSIAWNVGFVAACDWREDFDERARRWLEQSPALRSPRRVLLAGDPLPDDEMHRLIESCGASVVLELTGSAAADMPAAGDAFAAIAAAFQQRESPALSMRGNARWLAECAHRHRADAVILWLSEQDEALPWECPRQMESLRAARIPALLLARQPASTSPVLDQVQRFVRDAETST